MAVLSVNQKKCNLCEICTKICPFGAIQIEAGKVAINAACKFCRLCLKKCPQGAIVVIDEARAQLNKDEWKGILVFVEHLEGKIHPVTLELIGKAKELARSIQHPVYAVFIGSGIQDIARELLNYGVDKILVYDYVELKYFKVDTYANAFENSIHKLKPAIVLVGATSVGRSLAPRIATRFRTGLTADCTKLQIKPNTDLVQIRPAFGGNIMAQIVTTNTRPQFATVRYKVMETAQCIINPDGKVEICTLEPEKLKSAIGVLKVVPKEKQLNISDIEVLVVGGRGLKEPKDLTMLEELASLLGGQVAVTRPLVEAGWVQYTRQIGLSGRTVKPKLIITCGVSGAIQFTACMNTSERILSINKDQNAPIFKLAHYGIVGDLYEVVPALIQKIKGEAKSQCLIAK
jgi:electron transfer flavoprotein alpha subunit